MSLGVPHGIHSCVWGTHGAMGELKSPPHINDDPESSRMCKPTAPPPPLGGKLTREGLARLTLVMAMDLHPFATAWLGGPWQACRG